MGLKDVVEAAEEDDEVGQADAGAELDVGVGEQAALPVAGVGVLSALPRRALDQVAELALAADEEDDALAVGDVGGEVEGQLQVLHRLVQVDDVLIQAAAKDVGLHEPGEGTQGEAGTGHRVAFLGVAPPKLSHAAAPSWDQRSSLQNIPCCRAPVPAGLRGLWSPYPAPGPH